MKKEEAYKTLNLEDSASENEIKKAFRTLAAKNHPDQNKDDPNAESKFKKINEAYQILTGKQKAEDEVYSSNVSGFGGFGFNNVSDFIYDFFNQNRPNASRQNIIPINVNLPLTFEESVFGINKTFSFLVKIHCDNCDGTGKNLNSKKRCPKCDGNGSIKHVTKMGSFSKTIIGTCNECNGFGKIGDNCEKCFGNGFISKKKNVSLKIPPLGNKAKQFLVREQGNEYKNIKGDVIITAIPKIEGNGKFSGMIINGRNVISKVKISIDKLLFGGKIKVNTINGIKEVDIKKMTRPNDEITIHKCGVAEGKENFKKEFPQGNHIIIAQVDYPKENKLTEELKIELKKAYK